MSPWAVSDILILLRVRILGGFFLAASYRLERHQHYGADSFCFISIWAKGVIMFAADM